MEAEKSARLNTEMELLKAIYADHISFDNKVSEVRYSSNHGALHIRIPAGYPATELPEVISASGRDKEDIRDVMKLKLAALQPGEESLDVIIADFEDVLGETQSEEVRPQDSETTQRQNDVLQDESKHTVIVWLHHLLNISKRKQVLTPSMQDVTGVSKPGYPGVLIFSGVSHAVNNHVSELKQLNWQAFQVRFEEDAVWHFKHGVGVIEVETMKDIVSEIGDEKKDIFMKSMRMK